MPKIKNISCKCGCEDVYILSNGPHKGIYCQGCGAFIKWANKKEVNLYKISEYQNMQRG